MSIENDEVDPSWDSMAPKPKGGNNRPQNEVSLFMKLLPREEPYHVRLACRPISFRKHGWAFRTLKQWPISPATDPGEKDLDIAWKEGYYIPGEKFATFVFDRDSGNRLRIIEEGLGVFQPFYNHAKASKVNPASATKGWDWLIIVSEVEDIGPDGKKRKTRQYGVTLDTSKGATPFTDEEVKTLENPKFQRSELETRYFPKSSPEHIKELWLALPEELRKNPKKDQKNTKTQTERNTSTKSAAADTVTKSADTTTKSAATATVMTAKPVGQPADKAEPPAEVDDDTFLNEPQDGSTGETEDDQPAARLF